MFLNVWLIIWPNQQIVIGLKEGDGPAAAAKAGLEARYIPVVAGTVRDEDVAAFREAMAALPKPALAYCRTGTRSVTLWSLMEGESRPVAEILQKAMDAGYDMSGVARRILSGGKTPIVSLGGILGACRGKTGHQSCPQVKRIRV